MTRHGVGVFRHVLHVIPKDAGEIEFHGLDVRFAVCDIPCVPIDEAQEAPDEGAWPHATHAARAFPSPKEDPNDSP